MYPGFSLGSAKQSPTTLPFPHSGGDMDLRIRVSSLRGFFLAVAILLTASVSVLAQSTAVMRGTVSDPTGAVIPNAIITVRDQATSLERTAQTDSEGHYQVAAL